jgi:hypothetical protein
MDSRKLKLETCYRETGGDGMQPYPSIAVDDAVGIEIAEVFDGEDVADELVRRWNQHEALVDTLRETLRVLVTPTGLPDKGKRTTTQQAALDRALDLIDNLKA